MENHTLGWPEISLISSIIALIISITLNFRKQ